MAKDNFKPYPKGEEKHVDDSKKHHPPHPELPPHILKEFFDMKEKIGRLEGQMDILLRPKRE